MSHKHRTRAAVAITAIILAGCFGGSDDPVSTTVPPEAVSSIDNFIAFIAGLANTETGEPVTFDPNTVAPTDETSEPVAIGA